MVAWSVHEPGCGLDAFAERDTPSVGGSDRCTFDVLTERTVAFRAAERAEDRGVFREVMRRDSQLLSRSPGDIDL
jgi:hypothetical protein